MLHQISQNGLKLIEMQKYTNEIEVRYFEDDADLGNWIDLSEYRLMTDTEIDKHENPEKYLSYDEKYQLYLKSLRPLTRYQFKRCLLENGYKSEMIEAQILQIKDEMARELTLLGFKEATNFVRTDDSIIAMQSMLGLSDEKVDKFWEYALTL